MGVLSGKDIFSNKWITAIITDAGSMIHFVPIKHTLGDYFITDIDGQIYCFKIDGTRIKTWRKTLAKSFRVLFYDVSHYAPISPQDAKEIEITVTKNGLPKINDYLLRGLRLMGHKEHNNPFTEHRIEDLIAEISTKAEKYPEQVRNLTTYLKDLQIDKVVTPVKNVAEFIEGELNTTDPRFLGTIVSSYQRTDIEHKKVTNTPYNVKKNWLLIVMIIMIIGVAGFGIYYLYETGTFEGGIGIPGLDFGSTDPKDDPQYWISRYSPVELKAAVDRGEVDFEELPPPIKEMVIQVKLPDVEG